jgi:hypothetical protein
VNADMRIIKFSFVRCVICCPFFVRDSQDSNCFLIFLCFKLGPMYGFMYVFCVVWVGIFNILPFVCIGWALRSKYRVSLEW